MLAMAVRRDAYNLHVIQKHPLVEVVVHEVVTNLLQEFAQLVTKGV